MIDGVIGHTGRISCHNEGIAHVGVIGVTPLPTGPSEGTDRGLSESDLDVLEHLGDQGGDG